MRARLLLGAWCLVVLAAMLALTVDASLERGVFAALAALWPAPWFRATLADAYFAFLFVWLWVAWREASVARALGWLAAFLLLGNFAIAAYLLLRLRALAPEDTLERVLLRDRVSGR